MKVTVVGAGVVGCAVAHALASRGVDVRILDARGPGQGATRASAGILAPQIEGHTPELRQLAVASLALYDDFIHRVERDSGRPVEYRRTGTAQVALDAGEANQLVEEARLLKVAGVDHALVEPAEARRLEPALSDRVVAGLIVPGHGYVRASELTYALAEAAVARGARISTTSVLDVDGGGAVASVTTAQERIESDAVVIASGAWGVDSRPAPGPSVRPIRGQLVHLELGAPVLSRVIWGPGCYLVPWRDGAVLVGATVEDVGFDERSTADGIRGLLDAATSLAPGLGRAHLREVRVGLRPRAAGELPVIGGSTTMPRVFQAVGHYRNGVLLAPLTAALLADLMIDGHQRPELALVRPQATGETRPSVV